jgi:hypothetical protein
MLKIISIALISIAACYTTRKQDTKPIYDFKITYDTTKFSATSDTILYKPNTKINWTDFKGKPKPDLNVVAISNVGFKYDANIVQTDEKITVNIIIGSFFIKNKSWKLANVNEYILQHEQLHFDLARVGAQLLQENLSKRKINKDNFDTELQNAYNESWETYRKLQSNYDLETNHSLNETKQKEWTTKINTMISLCKY